MLQPGDFLRDRYKIESFLGRGGMADVYLALDMRRQTQVAIKVLREDLAEDPDFLRRFAREARALAHLDHPNIVRFYSFEQDGLTAFMVMDYVDGVTLRRRMMERKGPLELVEITSILQQISAALHYAHANGIIHRDLKPGNIMLQPNGKALLMDFGIAKLMENATLTTVSVGTPAYMSPEQILNRPVDHRADIYSLGVMLYQMATGRRPFTGEEAGLTATGAASRIREAHLRLAPPRPERLNPALPPEAGSTIMRALAKRPEDRWPDVMSLVRAWQKSVGMAGRVPLAPMPKRSVPPPTSPSIASSPATPTPHKKSLWPLGLVAGVVVVTLMLLVWIMMSKSQLGISTSAFPSSAQTTESIAKKIATIPLETPVATVDVAGAAQALAATYAAATREAEDTVQALAAARSQATMTAIVATATQEAERAMAMVAATATAQAAETKRLQATSTAQALATASIIAQQEATREANAQATRIALATATAKASGPPSCTIPVGGLFLSLWRQPSVYSQLGCPVEPAHTSLSAEERFERGFMLWRDSSDSVYVFFSDSTWVQSQDHFVEGRDPEYTCGTRQSPPSPRRGFSKVWCNYPGVRDKLGNALEREAGYGMTGGGPIETFQDFEGGMMYQSNHFNTIFILFDNGFWRQ